MKKVQFMQVLVVAICLQLLGCQSYNYLKITATRTHDGNIEIILCNLETDSGQFVPKGGSTTYARVHKNLQGDTASVFLSRLGLTDTLVNSAYARIETQFVAPGECHTSIRVSGDSGRLQVIHLPLFVNLRSMHITIESETTVALEKYEHFVGGFGPTIDSSKHRR